MQLAHSLLATRVCACVRVFLGLVLRVRVFHGRTFRGRVLRVLHVRVLPLRVLRVRVCMCASVCVGVHASPPHVLSLEFVFFPPVRLIRDESAT